MMRRSTIPTVALLAALASILWSDSWDIANRLNPQSQRQLDREARWDAALRSSAGGSGLFLRFINFAPADRQSALEFYFRAAYLLYPQPLIVAPPGTVILLAWQLIDANSVTPTDAWLRQHGVVAIQVVDGKSGIAQPQDVRSIAPARSLAAPPAPRFSLVWSAIYLGALLLAGYAVVGFCARDLAAAERFGLAAILGPGVFGFCMIALSMVRWQPSRTQIVSLAVMFALLAAIRSRVCRSTTPALPSPRNSQRFMLLAGILIAYGLVIVALDVTIFATPIWDAFAIWQFKAKVLAIAPLYPRPAYFYDVRLSFSHLRYPLLLPMISAGIQVANHSFREGLGKIPCYLFYLGMGACIWGLVRRCRGRTAAIIAAGLVLTLPVIYRFGGSGTAEMALTAFYAASITAILRWQQNQRWGDLLLAALASLAMAWTKNEGQALALINGLVILVLTPRPLARRNLLAVAAFAAIVVLLFAPWLLFIRGLPRTDEDYAARLNFHEMVTQLDRAPQIALAMLRECVSIKDWGIFWILPLALAVLPGARIRSRAILTLSVLLALQTLAYFPPYMVTIWTLKPLLLLTIDRMLMHMAPAAALLIGLLWPATQAPDC